MRDMKNNMDAVNSLDPNSYTATTNGNGVDIRDFDGALMVFSAGTVDVGNADEVYTPSVEESDDNSSYSAVASADLEGTLSNLTANSIQRVSYKGSKRYVRATLTISGTTPSVQAAAWVVRGMAHQAPTP